MENQLRKGFCSILTVLKEDKTSQYAEELLKT